MKGADPGFLERGIHIYNGFGVGVALLILSQFS